MSDATKAVFLSYVSPAFAIRLRFAMARLEATARQAGRRSDGEGTL